MIASAMACRSTSASEWPGESAVERESVDAADTQRPVGRERVHVESGADAQLLHGKVLIRSSRACAARIAAASGEIVGPGHLQVGRAAQHESRPMPQALDACDSSVTVASSTPANAWHSTR